MDRFLKKFNLPRLHQEEIEIMNNPITSTEIEAVTKKSPQKQKPRTKQLHRRILSNIQRRANAWIGIRRISKILSKNHRGRNTYKLILLGHHHPDTEARQRQHKKIKLQASINGEHRCKNPQQNFSKQNSTTHQKADQVGFIPGMQGFFSIPKSINVIHHINKLKDKNQMIISILWPPDEKN